MIDDTEKMKSEPTHGYFSDHLHREGFEKGRSERLNADNEHAKSALKDMKEKPQNVEIIGKGKIKQPNEGSYRNAPQHTAQQNKIFGTSYKPENVDKIKSENFGNKSSGDEKSGNKSFDNISVHAVRDNTSGNLFQGKHLKMKDEKVSTSRDNFRQNQKGITTTKPTSSQSALKQNKSTPTNDQGSGNSGKGTSALKQNKSTPTNNQGISNSGKGTSALRNFSANGSTITKPSSTSSGGATKTTSSSTSNTSSSNKGKSK